MTSTLNGISTHQVTPILRVFRPQKSRPLAATMRVMDEEVSKEGTAMRARPGTTASLLETGTIGMRQRWLLLVGFTTALVLVAAFGVRATDSSCTGTSRSIGRNIGLIRNTTTDYIHWTVVPGWGTQRWGWHRCPGRSRGDAERDSVRRASSISDVHRRCRKPDPLHEADVDDLRPRRGNRIVLLHLREGPVPRPVRRPHRMALANGRAGDHSGGVGGAPVRIGDLRRGLPNAGMTPRSCWEGRR